MAEIADEWRGQIPGNPKEEFGEVQSDPGMVHPLRAHHEDRLGSPEQRNSEPDGRDPYSLPESYNGRHVENSTAVGEGTERCAASSRTCAGSGVAFLGGLPENASMFTQAKTRLAIVLLLSGFIHLVAAGQQPPTSLPETASRLSASSKGRIKVAFVLTEHAVMIDFAGPWEVFQDVMVPSRGANMEDQHVFDLFTVSDRIEPIRTSGGLRVIPDYTFDNAPQPNVVVVPAQMGDSRKMMDWLRAMAKRSDVLMSVCTGAFKLGEAGLLDGKNATTHHGAYVSFERQFPSVKLLRNMRYVQSDPVVFTAGGLSSGIDLALHVVDLYFGREIAAATARNMEYEGKGWMGDGSAAENWTTVQKSHPSDHLTKGALGNWRGSLNAADGPAQVALHIWSETNGNLAGTIDDVDHDVNDVPLSAISLKNSALHLEAAGGTFDGALSADESSIEGTWILNDVSVHVQFKRLNP